MLNPNFNKRPQTHVLDTPKLNLDEAREGLITLETLEAAANLLQKQNGVDRSEIKIYSAMTNKQRRK